ncbi:MAG TPA: Omp28-related outer membrane protein [Flavipsychrobacter sp.]|nr:Omp28-related outer membrane protein [Flavipsychrobacter sp.]
MNKFITLLGASVLSIGFGANAQTVVQEDFNSTSGTALPASWTQVTKATTGWKTNTGSLSFTAGWAVPAGTGRYAVVDEWNNNENNDTTRLITPTFSLTGVSGAWLTYKSYFVKATYTSGSPTEDAYVLASTNGGTSWTVIDTVNANPTSWEANAVNLSAYNNAAAVQLAFSYHDGKGGTSKLIGLAIDDVKVYVPPTNEMAFVSATPVAGSPTAYGVASGTLNIGGVVYNNGSATITSYKLHYKQGSSAEVIDNITGVSIAPFTSATVTAPTALAMPATLGDYPVKMWVELTGDADASNDTTNTTVTAVSFMPTKKILAEEGTGTWCGWCPRGAVYMDSMAKTHPNNFSLIAVHNGDPMVVAAYDSYLGSKIGGYPSMLIDRREELDPSDLFDVYNEQKDYFGYADITLTDVPASGFGYSLKATVKPAVNLSGDYRLAMVLVEDDVKGTESGYAQANYYSGGAAGPMGGYESKPSKVPAADMVYNHVARMIVPGVNGAASSLPATMTAGSNYDYTFTTTIPQPYRRNEMHAVVMLIRNSDGVVLNTQNKTVPVGISNVAAALEAVRIVPNPATDKATVRFTVTENTTANVMVYDMTGRVVFSTTAADFATGAHTIDINTSNLPAGAYTVKLQTAKGATTQPLSVVK